MIGPERRLFRGLALRVRLVTIVMGERVLFTSDFSGLEGLVLQG